MTNQRQAKNNLIQKFTEEGLDFLVNRDLEQAGRFYGGEKNSLFFNFREDGKEDYSFILPEEINSIDELRELKVLLKKISADEYETAYFNKKKTEEIYYNNVLLANKYSLEGKFYPFDEKRRGEYFLTNNLFNLLSIIKKHRGLDKDLGVLLGDDFEVYAEKADLGSGKDILQKDSIAYLARWFKDSKINFHTNLPDSYPNFDFPYKGIFLDNKGEKHFVLVSDGTDEDLIKKYIATKKIKKIHKVKKPTIGKESYELESIIIASPYSKEGYLFRDDQLSLGGERVTHNSLDSKDQGMPEKEYLKSFQYCRLPFILFDRKQEKPFVSTLVSKESHPCISILYLYEGNPLHKFVPVAAHSF